MSVPFELTNLNARVCEGPCHLDMRSPLLIFSVALLVTVAICGTLEARSPVVVDDSKVANAENVVGPIDVDFITSCQRNSRDASAHRRCSETQAATTY